MSYTQLSQNATEGSVSASTLLRMDTFNGHIEDIDKIGMYAATNQLQHRANEVRNTRINWQSYLQGQMIDPEDYDFMVKLESLSAVPEQRKALLEANSDQFARTFFSMLAKISKDQTVQYVLTLLDDLLQEEKTRVDVFKRYMEQRKENVWSPFFSLLHRQDGFIVNQASRIVAKFACWGSRLMEQTDLVHYLNWLNEQLRIPSNEYLQTVARCLQMLLRVSQYRQVFCDIDGIGTLANVLSGKVNYQIQYQLVFCLWCLSFDADIVARMKKYNLIPICADILCESEKEKVNRIVCAFFRHLLEKPADSQLTQESALAMVHCKVLKQVELLAQKKYDDIEHEDDLKYLVEVLSNSIHDLSSFDEYASELKAGRLEWSPVHKSERFWRENAIRLNERNYELLKILVRLLESSKDSLVLCVAAHDVGEYVRHYPRGKTVIEQLGAKELVMKMLSSEDPNVRYNALIAVQKIMRNNLPEELPAAAEALRNPQLPMSAAVKREPMLAPGGSGDFKNGNTSSSDDDVPLAKKFNVAKRKASPPPTPSSEQSSSAAAATAGASSGGKASAEANGDQPSSKKVKKEPIESNGIEASSSSASAAARREKKKKLEKEKRREKEKEKERLAAKAKEKSKPTVNKDKKPVKKEGKPDEPEVWRWWEEAKPSDGSKWKFLEHKGPVFAPAYEPLPKSVKFYYDGEPMQLSPEAEENADHDYTSKDVFNNNFFQDWRSVMTHDEQKRIKSLKKCDFKEMHRYFTQQAEERKNRSKEEKLKLKQENERLMKEYGVCTLDGHKQKIANFRIEPPGLFRGRGNHPKMGKLKRRVRPEDVIINCSKDSKVPKPPDGRKWKEVRHDNTVSWLACWVENVQGNFKYVMLNAASRLKGEKDWKKYETARQLHKVVDKIRIELISKSKEMRLRQRAVALYFIDKLAFVLVMKRMTMKRILSDAARCATSTSSCTSSIQRWAIMLSNSTFLAKTRFGTTMQCLLRSGSSKICASLWRIRRRATTCLTGLNTSILNAHLKELMDGLTAKVFRTYNASKTLEEQLDKLTNPEEPVAAKILSYNRANREVAILCNHQRAVPKTFEKSMENLNKKVEEKEKAVKAAKREAKAAKVVAKRQKSVKNKQAYEKKKAALRRLEDQLLKLKVQKTDKDENKEIALGTSKLNYLDPRITVAWCRRFNVPVEKVYNKTQREKFQWAIDMAGPEFRFQDTDSDRGTNKMQGGDDDEEEDEEEDEES
uniref:DNA topoisomerase 1 n=1 Tax=Macrostomum lignano TaxID=282301 RepID=A0A1I8H623_9PLAT